MRPRPSSLPPRLRKMLTAVIALILIAAFYFSFDPAATSLMPKCVFHLATGLDCPGCGSQRLVHALLHGDIRAAWDANALLLILLPFIPAMIWLELTRDRHLRLYRAIHSRVSLIIIIVIIAGWMAVRNIPAFKAL